MRPKRKRQASILGPNRDLSVLDSGLASVVLKGDRARAAALIPTARIILEGRKAFSMDEDIRLLDEVIPLDEFGTLIRIQTVDDVDRLTIVAPEVVEAVDVARIARLELILFLENGYVDMHSAWLRLRAGRPIEERLPGYLYWPRQLTKLLEPFGGSSRANNTVIKTDDTLWHDRTYILNDGQNVTGEFRANSSPPINSESFSVQYQDAKLFCNRYLSVADHWMQLAGTGKFRTMTEAALGRDAAFRWLEPFSRPNTLQSTWGLYTALRYPNEATANKPAIFQYYLMEIREDSGILFWNLPIPGAIGEVVDEFLALGRESPADDFDIRFKRKRIEAHILSVLTPPEVRGANIDPPDFQTLPNDIDLSVIVGAPLDYGWQISPQGERAMVATRTPVRLPPDGGIDYWDHRLYRMTIELDEELLGRTGELIFLVEFEESEQVNVTPVRSDLLYVWSDEEQKHRYLRWDTFGKGADYATSGDGPGGVFNTPGAPFYCWYADDPAGYGVETIVRYELDYNPTYTEEVPPSFFGTWSADNLRACDFWNGASHEYSDDFYGGIGRIFSGFYVMQEQTPGQQDDELYADYRGQRSTDTAPMPYYYKYVRIQKGRIEAVRKVNADTNTDWDNGDIPPRPNPEPAEQGYACFPVTNPFQFGGDAPFQQSKTYGYGNRWFLNQRTEILPHSTLIIPSYGSEGAFLSFVANYEEVVASHQFREVRSSLRSVDDLTDWEDEGRIPSNEEVSWSPNGALGNSNDGGGITNTYEWITVGSNSRWRYLAYVDLLNQHEPMRVATRSYWINEAPSSEPKTTYQLQPGEDIQAVQLELEGRWRTLTNPTQPFGEEYYIDEWTARVGKGGPAFMDADFASSDLALRVAARGGIPAPTHKDVCFEGATLHDPEDVDENDPPAPDTPIVPVDFIPVDDTDTPPPIP